MADLVTTQTITDTSGVKFVSKLTNFRWYRRGFRKKD